jgi:hypothetical protein
MNKEVLENAAGDVSMPLVGGGGATVVCCCKTEQEHVGVTSKEVWN